MTFDTVLAYAHNGDLLCPECVKAYPEINPDTHEGVVFPGSEWDYQPTCGSCNVEIEGVTILGESYEDGITNMNRPFGTILAYAHNDTLYCPDCADTHPEVLSGQTILPGYALDRSPYCDGCGEEVYPVTMTEESDYFRCKKCNAWIAPWYLRCEGCGVDNPATWEPEPERWICGECGIDDYESQEDAEHCCSMFYCHECGYDRHELRESCLCETEDEKGENTMPISDAIKETIRDQTLVWNHAESDYRVDYIQDITPEERAKWGLADDTVAITVFLSEYTGEDWSELDAQELETFLGQDSADIAKCHCFDNDDDPAEYLEGCPVVHYPNY